MKTDPAQQIVALRTEIDTRQAVAEFLDAAARLADELGEIAESARFALDACVFEEGARLRTVRLLALVRAHPDIEVMP